MDETTAGKVVRYEESDLDSRQKAALGLADALMSQPGAITDERRDRLRRSFTDEEILELTLDVMKWNYQKVSVSLGTDAEVRPGQLTDLVFDTDGQWVHPADPG